MRSDSKVGNLRLLERGDDDLWKGSYSSFPLLSLLLFFSSLSLSSLVLFSSRIQCQTVRYCSEGPPFVSLLSPRSLELRRAATCSFFPLCRSSTSSLERLQAQMLPRRVELLLIALSVGFKGRIGERSGGGKTRRVRFEIE